MSSELDSNPRESKTLWLKERVDDLPEPLLKAVSVEKKPMSFLSFTGASLSVFLLIKLFF